VYGSTLLTHYVSLWFALGQQSMLPTNNKLQINTLIKELFEGQSILPTPKSISKFAHYIDGGLKKVHNEQL